MLLAAAVGAFAACDAERMVRPAAEARIAIDMPFSHIAVAVFPLLLMPILNYAVLLP